MTVPVDPSVPPSEATVDEKAVDAALRSVNENFALFGELHGRAVPIPDNLLRDILRGAILTYLLTYLDSVPPSQPEVHCDCGRSYVGPECFQ